ncbi:MAG: PAS domain S-box protein [Gemmatimonadales bacterium]
MVTAAAQRAIFASTALVSMTTDAKGVIQTFGSGAERMLGYSAAEVVGRVALSELAEPQELLARASAMSLAFATPIASGFDAIVAEALHGVESRLDLTLIRNDGRHLQTVMLVTPLRDAQAAIVGYLLIGIDTTAEAQRPAELERSQRQLRAFIDGLGPSIFAGLLTPGGILIEVNRTALLAAGLRPEDVLGKRFEETYWWSHSPEVRQRLQEAIERAGRGEPSRYDVQLRATDGQLIDVDFCLQVLRGEAGEVAFLVPSASVVTERQETRAALRQSDENFRLLTDHITDAFWIRSPDMSGVYYISPAFERIWGRSAESLRTKPHEWIDFTLQEDRARVRAAFAGLMANTPSIDIEYRIQRPDGEIRWVRARGFQARDETGKLARLTGIVTDITEQKQLESRSLQALRMESIGTLAGGIAHDLNNVLAPILMSIAMLKDLVADAEGLTLLATLQDSAQRGTDLVKQVLSFARGVEGQRIAVDTSHLIRELFRVMQDTFSRSIVLHLSPPPDSWTVIGDPTQIHQVFLNLCVNARDAMPNGGDLRITMTNAVLDPTGVGLHGNAPVGPYVIVKVEDTGTGIPVEIRDRIFEPFFTTKGIGRGTGLGLATTMAIVRSHGGFIDVDSEVGRGTAFSVYLPATPMGAAPDTVDPAQTRLPRGNGELILLVDDEEAIRNVGKRLLERFGYRVLLACEGAEALTLYVQHRQELALVVTDMAMPVMDGRALIVALVALDPQVRIIGSSGLSSDAGIAKSLGTGVEHFVSKPYTAEDMLTTIHDVLAEQAAPTG